MSVVVASPARLWTAADELLQFAVDVLADNGRAAPDRQYVAEGGVAFDCEQLVVQVARVFLGAPGEQVTDPVNCSATLVADLTVWLIKCAAPMGDNGEPPSDEEIEAVSQVLLTDGLVLTEGLIRGLQGHQVFTSLESPAVAIGELAPQGPEGGMAGWTLTVSVGLL